MVNYAVTSVTTLNKYIWAEIQDKLGWQLVNGKVPITTAQEGPEFEDGTKPYIVYTYSKVGSPGGNWFMKQEQVTYRIVSPLEGDVRQFLNLMEDALNRYDVSAKDVNNFVARTQPPEFDAHKIDYKSIYVYSAEGADAQESEGGRSDGVLTVRILYTRPSDYSAF